MTRLLLLIPFVALAGCAAKPVAVRTVTVKVPVATSCVPPSLPSSPSYPDTDHALRTAVDSAERYRLLILGREYRIARLGVLEGVVNACKEPPE